jgi:hypothetical protein
MDYLFIIIGSYISGGCCCISDCWTDLLDAVVELFTLLYNNFYIFEGTLMLKSLVLLSQQVFYFPPMPKDVFYDTLDFFHL